jgi:hypothetical protein
VRKHLAALNHAQVPDALAIYALLGQHSLQLTAHWGKVDESALTEIARLLAMKS